MERGNQPPGRQVPRHWTMAVEPVAARTRRAQFPSLPARLVAGDRLAHYQISRELHCGGHASVFEAQDRRDSRSVALKVLSPQLALIPDALRRFRAESALAERVRHPSLVPIHGSGHESGYHFYAMTLCRGRPIEELAALSLNERDPRHYIDLASRFVPLAAAVSRLHQAGIVHRDIKPSNVLEDGDGRLLLADFGSALDTVDAAASGVERGGTVLYMSPEQLCPGADPRDPRADIYSLGMTLYEVASGYPPFPLLPDAELARWKLTRLPPLPRHLNPHLPMALEAIIRQAIQPRPDLRYASAEELASDLERFSRRRRAFPRAGGSSCD